MVLSNLALFDYSSDLYIFLVHIAVAFVLSF